jgi:hypothetical protein
MIAGALAEDFDQEPHHHKPKRREAQKLKHVH